MTMDEQWEFLCNKVDELVASGVDYFVAYPLAREAQRVEVVRRAAEDAQ